MSQDFENSTPNPETVNVFLNNKLNDEELNAIVSLDDIQKTISLINSGGNGSFDPDVIDRLGKKMDKFELHTPIPQLYIAANIHIRKHLNPYVHATADEYDCVIKLKKQLAMRLIAKNTTNVFRRVKALPKSTTVEELKLLQDLIGEINFFEFDMLDMATAGVDILRELDFTWTPSIAVSAVQIYKGDEFKEWNGHILMTSLKDETIRKLEFINENNVGKEVVIVKGKLNRIRDLKISDDGKIYILSNGAGALSVIKK